MRSGLVGGDRKTEQSDESTKIGHRVLDRDELCPSPKAICLLRVQTA
jgi:hypothetical protein